MRIHSEHFDGFDIEVSALPEDCSPEGSFASGDDEADAETVRRIRDGELTWFVAKVTASKNGIELGVDYLCGCCYNTEADFLTDGYYEDMRAAAVEAARAAIAALQE